MNLFANRSLIAWNGVDSQSPLDYVHPLRRADLQKILAHVPDSVEMIIVYGSSLGDYLLDDSDLDLAVVSRDKACFNPKVLEKMALDAVVDVQVFPTLDDLIEQAEGFFPTPRAIVDEGLPVYMKGKAVRLV